MDDLEFRRRAYAEPDCQDKDFIEFKNSSIENRSFVEELKVLDQDLRQAMQLKPPEDILERIKLRQTLDQYERSRKHMKHWSLVASLFLAMSLSFVYFLDSNSDVRLGQNLDENILQHIRHELDHLQDQQNKTLKQVNALLSEFGSRLNETIGQVNYLGSCDIANKKGVHMVVQGKTGPVTVMLLPDIAVGGQRLINGQRFKGLIMPFGKGSIAIVGEKSEPLQGLKSRLEDHMRWI